MILFKSRMRRQNKRARKSGVRMVYKELVVHLRLMHLMLYLLLVLSVSACIENPASAPKAPSGPSVPGELSPNQVDPAQNELVKELEQEEAFLEDIEQGIANVDI